MLPTSPPEGGPWEHPPPRADRPPPGHRIPLTSNLLNSNGTNYVTLYFPQLEWAELAPHKVTGKIFGWFRRPGPQRLTCDGRPCPDLGSEVCRHRCPPDTGQLCAVHEAWEPLGRTRPSPPTHVQGPSCQNNLVIGPAEGASGPCLGGPQRSSCGLVSTATQEMPVGYPGHSLAPAGIHPQPSFLPDSSAFRPPCLCSCHSSCLEQHHSQSSPSSPVLPLPAPPKVLLSPPLGGSAHAGTHPSMS